MSSLCITVKSEEVVGHLNQHYKKPLNDVRGEALALSQFFKDLASLNKRGVIDVQTDTSNPVAATATATLVSCATDTITIAGVTFTGSGSPSGEAQFETDGNDAADAAALAAKVNAHSTLSKIISAVAVDNVVTFTCLVKGVIGNFLAITESGTTITVTAFSGGTGGVREAASQYALGI